MPDSRTRRAHLLRSLAASAIACVLAASAAVAPVVSRAATWGAANPGNLLTDSNWSGGLAPNGTDTTANFAASKPTADGDFTLNSTMTVGTFLYNNSGERFLTGSGTLRFQVSSGMAKFQTRDGGESGYLGLDIPSIVLASTTEFSADATFIPVYSTISGAGGFEKTGDGSVQLNATNSSYTGLNVISEGRLSGSVIANSGVNSSFGRGNFEISNFATLSIDHDATTNRTITLAGGGGQIDVAQGGFGGPPTLIWAGVISGSGTLLKSGPGTLQLNANNTYDSSSVYSGSEIYDGTLRLGASERIPDSSAVYIDASGAFDLAGSSETIAGLYGDGGVTLGNGNLTINATKGEFLPFPPFGFFYYSFSHSGVIGGNGGLTKTGPGTQTLTGSNTYSGGTTISGGMLSGDTLANNGTNSAFGRGNFVLSGGGILDYTGPSTTINRTVTLNSGGGVISVSRTTSGATLTISGLVSGPGGLTKSGGRALQLTGNNSYAGDTIILGGSLGGNTIADFGSNSSFGRGNFAISNHARLQYTGGTTSTNRTFNLGAGGGAIDVNEVATVLTLNGVVGGVGDLYIESGGTVQLNASNNYGGATIINTGTLRLGGHERIPDGSAVSIANSAVFNLNNFNQTIGSLASSSATAGVVLGSGTLYTGGNGNAASTTFAGVISGTGGLSINGSGAMTLTGANTYAGGTSVHAGKLLVNNTSGSGTGSGLVAVNNDATLGGTGMIASNLTFNDMSTLAPGASAGTLTVNGQLVLNSQSVLAYDLNGSNQTAGMNVNDLVVVGAGLTLDGTLNVTSAGGNFATAPLGSQWRLFNYTGSFVNNGLAIGSMPTLAQPYWGFVVDTSTSGQVNVLIAIVPEARAWLMLTLPAALTACGLASHRLRAKHASDLTPAPPTT